MAASYSNARVLVDMKLDRVASLETYQQLHAEQQSIRRRLSVSSATLSRSSTMESTTASSPDEFGHFDVNQISQIEHVEARRLVEIEQHIKNTLTDLLNCKSIKNDSAARAWVQDRLMDNQMELKRERRRRSSCIEI